jgi:hypothetical protein
MVVDGQCLQYSWCWTLMGMCNPQQGVSEIDYCHIYPQICDLKPLSARKMCLNLLNNRL